MRFRVTFFDNVFANSCRGEDMTLDELAELVRNISAPKKDKLPLLKCARFGPQRSNNSLRHDANVVMVSGIEADYDGEAMPLAEAAARLDAAGIAYLGYTTGRHTAAKPRWRMICPFAAELPPARRAAMVDRVNGVLGGALSRESWVTSQAFYYGAVTGVDFEIVVGAGDECIDEADELDPGLPFQPLAGQGAPQGPPAGGKRGKPDYQKLSEAELLDLIADALHYFGPASELARRWAYQGIPAADAEANSDRRL